LDYSNFPYLAPAQVAKLTPKQVASIPNDYWFNKIPDAAVHDFGRQQVRAIKEPIWQRVKGRFTPEQRAWR
ncbi:MAG: hypothetical protein D6739_02075, partial [Nitrospirae bacterium]